MKLATVRRYAMSLPEVTEEPHHQYSSFRVHGKIFVTVPPDEQHIHIFLSEALREPALAMDPEFLEPLRWGKKVVGLRANLPKANAAVIKKLISSARETKAPKR